MKRLPTYCIAIFILCTALPCMAAPEPVESPEPSEATSECLGCHEAVHPGIVEGWKKSRHALIPPHQAMQVKDPLARKVSAQKIPDDLSQNVVGCAECHTVRADKHKDTFDHNGYQVHVVVSPADCATCHPQEAHQFGHNKMSHAYGNLKNNNLYNKLELSINGRPSLKGGHIELSDPGPEVAAASCYHCHGTKLETMETAERETELGGHGISGHFRLAQQRCGPHQPGRQHGLVRGLPFPP